MRTSFLAAIPAALVIAMFATPGVLMVPLAVIGLASVGLVRLAGR